VAVVSNSSPLIALARIERLDFLPAIFESLLIPGLLLVRSRLRSRFSLLGCEYRRRASSHQRLCCAGAWVRASGRPWRSPSSSGLTGSYESVRPELDALLRTSFFLNPKLHDELLRAAGEIDW
jgi:hypothetical protein